MTTIPAGNPHARVYPGEAVQTPEAHEPDAYSYELSYADMLTVACPILRGYPDWAGEPGEPDRICQLEPSHEGLHHAAWSEREWGETEHYEAWWNAQGERVWPCP
jgi:hypothetical protein